MHPPRAFVERFAREHPRLALLMLAWWFGLVGFVAWVFVSDWKAGR